MSKKEKKMLIALECAAMWREIWKQLVLFYMICILECLRCLPISIAKGLLLALLDPAFPFPLCAPPLSCPTASILFPW